MTLRVLAALTLLTNALGALVSISRRMPAEFGRGVLGRFAVVERRERVARGFVTWKGTAIAPPLPMMVALAGLARVEGRRTRGGARAIAAFGAAGTLGHLGEPVTWRAFRRRVPLVPAALALASLALYGSMAVLGVIEARRRA